MLQKHFVYIILWFLFQLLIEINCQKSSYLPKKRNEHTATLIDNKLYILGGSSIDNVGKDFFYIDFSVPFNIKNLLLKDLSNINTVPAHFGAASAKGGANNDTLFICGGVGNTTVNKINKIELVYTFNPQNNLWSIPIITGGPPITPFAAETGIINHNGIIYFWDGIGPSVNILDTINLIWKKGSSIGAIKGGFGSAATLLPDNKIIYMGGAGEKLTLMNQVYIYDTINDIWSTKTTSGAVPSNRQGLTAVLGLDGQRVIIFGGVPTNGTFKNPLYELNLINFEWRIPKTSGSTPASRSLHRANVIGKYMVISFGISYFQPENDFLLLDISNVNEYIWTNEFNPSSTTTSMSITSPLSSSPNNPAKNDIGMIIVVCLAVVAIIFLTCCFMRKCTNNSRNSHNNGQANNNQDERNDYYPGQEIVQPLAPLPVISKNINENTNESNYNNNQTNNNQAGKNDYYPGQEIIQPSTSISVVDKSTSEEIKELKLEIQNLKQIILQSKN